MKAQMNRNFVPDDINSRHKDWRVVKTRVSILVSKRAAVLVEAS